MGKTNQETITTFAEVFSSSGISSHQNNRTANTNDNRLMIYFQGMKLYIPDAKTGYYTGKGVFTIVAESAGTGSTKGWGKLKSGAGWVALDYCARI